MQTDDKSPMKVRSVWISDVHLGFHRCSAGLLLEFFHSVECEYLYLVGGIIAIWEMKKCMYWPQQHTNVVRAPLSKAQHGTKVIHTTVDDKKLLILHRDRFDGLIVASPMIAKIGSRLYDSLLKTRGGDGVTSCTALVAPPNGDIEMIKWTDSHRTINKALQLKAA